VAIQIVDSCVTKWRGSKSGLGIIGQKAGGGYIGGLPTFVNKYFFVILIVAVLTVLMTIYLKKTKQGYELTVVGESLNTARYAGINVTKVIIRTVFISGAIAGFCGFLYVSGINHTIATTTGGNNGFTAIVVAWIAQVNPAYMVLVSFLLVFLQYGAKQISSDYSGLLNDYAGDVIKAIFIFCIIAFVFFINYKIVLRDGKFKNALDKISAALHKVFDPVGRFFKKIFSPVAKFFGKITLSIKLSIKGLFAKIGKKQKVEAVETSEAADEKKSEDNGGEQ
jgi:simple sugar transport system permease protein